MYYFPNRNKRNKSGWCLLPLLVISAGSCSKLYRYVSGVFAKSVGALFFPVSQCCLFHCTPSACSTQTLPVWRLYKRGGGVWMHIYECSNYTYGVEFTSHSHLNHLADAFTQSVSEKVHQRSTDGEHVIWNEVLPVWIQTSATSTINLMQITWHYIT